MFLSAVDAALFIFKNIVFSSVVLRDTTVLTVNIFSITYIEKVYLLGVNKTEFDPIILVNPKTPHLFMMWFQLLGT